MHDIALSRQMTYFAAIANPASGRIPNIHSKFQTNDPSSIAPKGNIPGSLGLVKRCDTIVMTVLVIEF
jgi:hypothetical protein